MKTLNAGVFTLMLLLIFGSVGIGAQQRERAPRNADWSSFTAGGWAGGCGEMKCQNYPNTTPTYYPGYGDVCAGTGTDVDGA